MITGEQLGQMKVFSGAPIAELEVLADRAADIDLRPGDWLVSEGEVPAYFGVIDGALEVLKQSGAFDPHRIAVYESGDTFGEVPLLLDAPALASVRAIDHARVFRIESGDFHKLVLECHVVRDRLLSAMSTRIAALRDIAIESTKSEVTIVGRRLDLACHDARDFLARNHIPFVWLDPDDEHTRHRLPADFQDDSQYPIVMIGERKLIAPTLRELAEAVHLRTAPSTDVYDLAIIGAGPAGLAAAVYGASEGLTTALFEREAPGGQAGTSSRIENYLGFPTGLSGDDLAKRALRQATRFGAEIVVTREVKRIVPRSGEPHELYLDDESCMRAHAIVLATGVSWRRLEAPGLDKFFGRGVYYGAARSEAFGTRGKHVHLVGGGNSAGQAAMFFSGYAQSVTILVRGSGLKATMSQYLIDELATRANVSVEGHREVVGARGSDHLEELDVRDTTSDEVRAVPSDALFIFIGADAETAWLPERVIKDERGYVCTGRDVMDLVRDAGRGTWPLPRDPFTLETSVPGIFAAGDVRHGSIKRVAAGVGEGSMTVAFIHQYLESLREAQPA